MLVLLRQGPVDAGAETLAKAVHPDPKGVHTEAQASGKVLAGTCSIPPASAVVVQQHLAIGWMEPREAVFQAAIEPLVERNVAGGGKSAERCVAVFAPQVLLPDSHSDAVAISDHVLDHLAGEQPSGYAVECLVREIFRPRHATSREVERQLPAEVLIGDAVGGAKPIQERSKRRCAQA